MNAAERQEEKGYLDDIFAEMRMQRIEAGKKVIRSARNSMFILGGMQLLFSLLAFIRNDLSFSGQLIDVAFGFVVAAIFTAMGFLCNTKPFIALSVGLVLYIIVIILSSVAVPANLLKGIFLKLLIVFWLVNAIFKARQLEEIAHEDN